MQLEVIQVKNETKPNKNGGTYQQLEVAYKNLSDGKVAAKKVMSFSNPAVFNTLANAKSGEVFEITSEKKGDFWEWTNAAQAVPGATVAPISAPVPFSKQPVKSTYETPEERAKRQIYIIKQSSVSSAIAYHALNSKSVPDLSVVLNTAQQIVNFCTTTALTEMENDFPFEIPEVK